MRFLKAKLARAQKKAIMQQEEDDIPSIQTKPIQKKVRPAKPESPNPYQNNFNLETPKSSTENLSLKNLAKNYGRAICNFILLDIADPYLYAIPETSMIEVKAFRKYIQEKKDHLNGVAELRSLLVVQSKDTEKTINYKKVFQQLAQVFIKYFSVNWIFSGKLTYKLEYLKYRSKLLRKIRNPQTLDCLK